MRPPGPDQFYAEIRASADTLGQLAADCDPDLPVPACPDWTLRQLATHVGRVHRWAAEIVRTRSAERIPFSAVPDGSYPAEPAARAAWLRAGADRVIAAIQAAGPEPVWAFDGLAPAGFWARRQAHETMMHRADAELAAGLPVALDLELAADGIDEWLAAAAGFRRPRDGAGGWPAVLPAGARLRFLATGLSPAAGPVSVEGPPTAAGPASAAGSGTAGWVVSEAGGRLVVRREDGDAAAADDAATTTVTAPADRLLLVLVRRRPASDPAVSVIGSRPVLAAWLAGTPF